MKSCFLIDTLINTFNLCAFVRLIFTAWRSVDRRHAVSALWRKHSTSRNVDAVSWYLCHTLSMATRIAYEIRNGKRVTMYYIFHISRSREMNRCTPRFPVVNYWNVSHEESRDRHTSAGLMCCSSSANHVKAEDLMLRTDQIRVLECQYKCTL